MISTKRWLQAMTPDELLDYYENACFNYVHKPNKTNCVRISDIRREIHRRIIHVEPKEVNK